MLTYVERNVTIARPRADAEVLRAVELLNYRHVVLTGAPGLGKTRLLQHLAGNVGATLRTTRQFLLDVRDPAFRERMLHKPLFIDALDEARGRRGDDVLDEVAGTLIELGRPAFVLTTRSLDWHGASDRAVLQRAVPGGETLVEAELLPFDDDNAVAALRGVLGDPAAFVARLRRAGATELLTNPETLRLLVEALGGDDDGVPLTKREVVERAVGAMLRETNLEHAGQVRIGFEELRAEAERLCALRLIVGADGFAIAPGADDGKSIGVDQLCRDQAHRQVVTAVLGTRLFDASSDGIVRGPHRIVAESLGGAHLGRLVDDEGLPASRVLALLTGAGGRPVTALRGLFASFATQCERQRELLLARDPAGLLTYGDAGLWRPETRRAFLGVVREHASLVPLFTFSPTALACPHLADPQLIDDYRAVLREPEDCPDLTHVVLAALASGPPVPNLSKPLLRSVAQPLESLGLRSRALDALLNCAPERRPELAGFVRQLRDVAYTRDEFEIAGQILYRGFPEWIDTATALSVLKPVRDDHFVGRFTVFWRTRAWRRWPCDHLLDAAAAGIRALGVERRRWRFDSSERRTHVIDFVLGCLARWLDETDDDPGSHDVVEWLLIVAEERLSSTRNEIWEGIEASLDDAEKARRIAVRHVGRLTEAAQAAELAGWQCGHLRSDGLRVALADALVERYRSEGETERRRSWLAAAFELYFQVQDKALANINKLLAEAL